MAHIIKRLLITGVAFLTVGLNVSCRNRTKALQTGASNEAIFTISKPTGLNRMVTMTSVESNEQVINEMITVAVQPFAVPPGSYTIIIKDTNATGQIVATTEACTGGGPQTIPLKSGTNIIPPPCPTSLGIPSNGVPSGSIPNPDGTSAGGSNTGGSNTGGSNTGGSDSGGNCAGSVCVNIEVKEK